MKLEYHFSIKPDPSLKKCKPPFVHIGDFGLGYITVFPPEI